MKKRFTEEQIIQVLDEVKSGMSVDEVCRKHGVASATFYNWRAKFGGMVVSDAKKLRALEEENNKLKRIIANQALDIVALKDVVSQKW